MVGAAEAPIWRQRSPRMGHHPSECSIFSKSTPICGALSPKVKQRCANSRGLTYHHCPWPTWEICASCLCNFEQCLSGRPASSRWMSPSGNTAGVLSNFKLWLLPRLFRILVPGDQQAKRTAMILWRINDSGYQKELGLLISNGDREEDFHIQMIHWISLGALKIQAK